MYNFRMKSKLGDLIIFNLQLYLAESYIYGTAMSSGKLYKINIQSGHTSILVLNDFEIDVGSALIYLNTETKNRFTIKSNVEKIGL
jgi:hypothetical protein